ncbi:SAGA-associated factor 29-like [Acanthaster planci]|uniref:SAGA-associated factor 29-like n=1 Tax=Acanthaster planci TaxID=133434 RepID=A0A8B7XZD9_ACAPL|nr:SAGA-associated factor 29-like [Acanthaster planci]XP_022086269.1 SAGA-associated factor 29-like [Acanthaster planci]
MRRAKSAPSTTSGGSTSTAPASSSADKNMTSATTTAAAAEKTTGSAQGAAASPAAQAHAAITDAGASIQDMLKELHRLVKETQMERAKSEQTLQTINKTHERMHSEGKISPYFKSKLRTLYQSAVTEAESEAEILRKALKKIADIKAVRNEQRLQAKNAGLYTDADGPRKTMRRGVLMTMLQQAALTLPLWIGRPGESPPALCGAVPAENNYLAKPGDKVAARVKGIDGDENWILAEVVSFNPATNKYEVDDIDEEGKERHLLSKRRIVPLPLMKANPETNPEALFKKGTLVMALYPQTTCFYRALIDAPPEGPMDDYNVLFEDNSYADGYSPALKVAQRYVVQVKEPRRR